MKNLKQYFAYKKDTKAFVHMYMHEPKETPFDYTEIAPPGDKSDWRNYKFVDGEWVLR